MLIAYLIAVTIITIIATFPTFWIRKLTAWIARTEAKRRDATGGGNIP
jgi:predicted nucleotidyltransferase